jgi:excisionase family DNA binding protein
MEQLLDVQNVAELLNVKESTIRAWVFQRKIPHIRVGRLVRFEEKRIQQWLNRKQDRI